MRAPPFLVSFDSAEEYFSALSDETISLHKNQIIDLINKRLPPLVSIRCLAVLFGFSPKFIGSLLTHTEKYYRVFKIKKGKKIRQIQAPKIGLKVIQKWLTEHLSKTVQLEECAYGFVPGKSYVHAAKKHLNAKWIYSVDIENFFQTTSILKVKEVFLKLGYCEKGAKIVSTLCCYNGYLAQGSPASPVLSNLIFTNLDKIISVEAEKLGITYTRYADDLVFSGKEEFPEEIKKVKNLIEEAGWKISEKKEHFSKLPNRLKVHGLLVHGDFVRLTKGYRNKIRAFRYLMQANKVDKKDVSRIGGHITLAHHIELQAP